MKNQLIYEENTPNIGSISLHTSKKGWVSISPSSDLTCFIFSKEAENTVPVVSPIITANISTMALDQEQRQSN